MSPRHWFHARPMPSLMKRRARCAICRAPARSSAIRIHAVHARASGACTRRATALVASCCRRPPSAAASPHWFQARRRPSPAKALAADCSRRRLSARAAACSLHPLSACLSSRCTNDDTALRIAVRLAARSSAYSAHAFQPSRCPRCTSDETARAIFCRAIAASRQLLSALRFARPSGDSVERQPRSLLAACAASSAKSRQLSNARCWLP